MKRVCSQNTIKDENQVTSCILPLRNKYLRMKRIILLFMVMGFLTAYYPINSNAGTNEESPTTITINTSPVDSIMAADLVLRLQEIFVLDKSGLMRPERQALRKEVLSINDQLKQIGDGIYISAGAVIIILILLIILL